jgi:hypothetical protein
MILYAIEIIVVLWFLIIGLGMLEIVLQNRNEIAKSFFHNISRLIFSPTVIFGIVLFLFVKYII